MKDYTYKELVEANMLVSKCCVCGEVIGYKEAGRCLEIGDEVISHTYCTQCGLSLMEK